MGLIRAFREALVGLWRTGMVGLVSMATTGASLLVLGVFGQFIFGGYQLADSLRDRVEIDIYLKDSVRRGQALSLAGDLEGMSGVAEATYIDKNDAADEFQSMFGQGMLEVLSQNPLPTSIRVRMEGGPNLMDRAEAVTQSVVGRKEVEGIDRGDSWLESLDRFMRVVTWVGVLLGGVLCLACAFAVSNTAKLMVLAQREAIEIMRLVGATRAFIRLTFLVGGALQGGAGGILAAISLGYGASWWQAWFPDLILFPAFYPGLGLVFLGTFLGVLGSRASLNRVLHAVVLK